MSVIKHSVTPTVETVQGMIDGTPTVNRVLAYLGDVPGTEKWKLQTITTSEPGSTQYEGHT